LLVSAVLLLAGGKIGDRIGHRNAFTWGICIFAIASAFCGFSPNVYWLIAARGLQGLGAALLIPASSPLIMAFFPQHERGKAIGINASVSSLFMIMAPLIGGYLTETLSWRWIFWVNLPLALLGIWLIFTYIPSDFTKNTSEHTFDFIGFTYFTLAATCLITPIMQVSDWGWTSIGSLYLFAGTLLSTYLLYRREKRSKHAFIDRSLYRHPIYKAVNISVFTIQFILMISVYRAVFFQEAIGWSPIKSGTIFSLTSLPVLFISPLGGWLADRFGPKVPITIGFLLLIFSFFWLAYFVEGSLGLVLIGLIPFGIGIPMVFTPSYSAAMGSIPPKKAGEAFALLATVRALAASLGVAIITSLANYLQFHSFERLLQSNPTTNQLNPTLNYLKISQIHSFTVIHILIGFLLIIAFALVFSLHHRKASHHLPPTPAEGWD
jgi:EmrB/QacA subfamily drug resistance transporter